MFFYLAKNRPIVWKKQDPDTVPKVTLNFEETQGDEESLTGLEPIRFY